MIWVELHENEASRAKRRCLQMLEKVAIRCYASEFLCSRVWKEGLPRKRGKHYFHTFPEERKLFLKWIVANISKEQRTQEFARDNSSHRIIFLHLQGVKGLKNQQQFLLYFTERRDPQ